MSHIESLNALGTGAGGGGGGVCGAAAVNYLDFCIHSHLSASFEHAGMRPEIEGVLTAVNRLGFNRQHA